jgi:hypothetical protein
MKILLLVAFFVGASGHMGQDAPPEPGAAATEQDGELRPPALPPDLPGREDALLLVPGDPLLQDRLWVVYWPGGEARAARVVETLERRPYLPGIPPEYPERALLFMAPDEDTWRALTGGRVPHWGAGVAIPALDRIVLPTFQTPWDGFQSEARTVRHEWAHLGLHGYLSGLRIPRWFDEGYAQWAAGGWDLQEAWRLRIALAGGQAPPLDSLTLAWPRDQAGAELAYLLSATAVEYLVRESGTAGIELFLERWRESGDFEGAFRRTFGMTTGSFERQWVAHVRSRYGWLLVLGQSTIFWLLLGVGLLVLFRIRRRRDRERMAELRAEEAPELPAYWQPPQHPPIGGFREDRERSRRNARTG